MSQFGDFGSQVLKLLQNDWGTWKGLLFAVVLSISLGLVGEDWPQKLLISLAIFLFLAATWSQARWQWWGLWQKNKIRFLVAIYCADELVEAQVDEDFTRELRILVKDGNLGRDVVIVQASRAECRDAEGQAGIRNLMDRKRAHVLVLGRVRRREFAGGSSLYVELRAAIRHAVLEAKAQKSFASEMTSVFPSGILQIPVGEQLPQLKVTADWVGVSTRYIMSLAAGVSGDLDYAEKMLSDATMLVPRLSIDIAKRTKINDRLLIRLFELHRAQARRSFSAWRKTRARSDALRMKDYLERALQRAPKDASLKQMLATTNFVLTGDAVVAERELRAAMFDNPAVYASLAFALAMQGRYADARKAYRAAWKRKPDQDMVDQLVTFCDWFKSAYPQFLDQTIWCEIQVASFHKMDGDDRAKKIDYLLRKGFGDAGEQALLKQPA